MVGWLTGVLALAAGPFRRASAAVAGDRAIHRRVVCGRQRVFDGDGILAERGGERGLRAAVCDPAGRNVPARSATGKVTGPRGWFMLARDFAFVEGAASTSIEGLTPLDLICDFVA
ncbi:MAG: hypothetical protein IPK52_20825 [Chloroflexi bacterium]|nr:hypothetical protein [Chloroflexota bacterium]